MINLTRHLQLRILQKLLSLCLCLSLLFLPTVSLAAKKTAKKKVPDKPEAPYQVNNPKGWPLSKAGDCDTLTLYWHNPVDPLQQLFFFPRFGPVYMSQEQKSQDLQYELLSGQSSGRRDMPVVNPLNPQNFSRYLPQVLQLQSMRDFLPDRPDIRVVKPLAVFPQKKSLEYIDTQTAVIRFLFVQDNQLGEGLIAITTVPSPEYRSNPGGGIGMGFMLYGMTAAKGNLSSQFAELLELGRSFKISDSYEKKCRKERAEDAPTLLQTGHSLRPMLDTMASVWEKRTPDENMAVEKKADELRQVQRLYRPASGEVYEFPQEAARNYLNNPGVYRIADLIPLPDDPELWQKPVRNGPQALQKP